MKKINWLAASLFILYASITAVVTFPLWSQFSGTEAFAIAKHIAVLLALVAYLVIQPKIGSWVIALWGFGVPSEKYAILGNELVAGELGSSGALATTDEIRLLLLLTGACMSACLAVKLLSSKNQDQTRGCESAKA